MLQPRKGNFMKTLKYVVRLTAFEKVLYKNITIVIGAIVLLVLLSQTSALAILLAFGIGWFANQKYELKTKGKKGRPKKKVA